MNRQTSNKFLVWTFFFLIQLLIAPLLLALDVPRLRGRVNDYADMISGSTESQLDSKLKSLEESDSTQLVVLTIPSLEGEPLEEYSIRVAEEWEIGQKEYDNGLLLLVSKNDRKVRIEVGYGLEGRLTDLLAGRIIDYEIRPNFEAGRFNEGFIMGVDAIVQAVKGEYEGSGKTTVTATRRLSRGSLMPFIILLIVISMLGSKRRIIGAAAGAILLPLVAWFSLSLGLTMLLVMIPFGFLGGLILPGMYFFPGIGYGRRSGRSGFGGGFGSGGFSGGGGGFGGGGASGGW